MARAPGSSVRWSADTGAAHRSTTAAQTAASRARTSASDSPATRTTLSRERSPRTSATVEGATPSARARSWRTAVLASPSTGGAVTRTRSASSCHATISSREARGWTRRCTSAPSGRAVGGIGNLLGGEEAIVSRKGVAEIVDQLPAHAPERLELQPQPGFLGAVLLGQLFAAQLGVTDDHL